MKSKAQKRTEAIERNAKYRDEYMEQAAERFPNDSEKQKSFADMKQGIPKKRF